MIEDELKYKIDNMELIQLVVDIEVKHCILQTCFKSFSLNIALPLGMRQSIPKL